jgi:alkylation response protein AidB-like acyl-CoA dehydrogenase
MGAALLPEPFAECAIAPAALLAAAPASSRRDALLAGLVGGEQRVAVAWQDAPGSLVPHWEGVAFTRSAGELRGTGGKRFVPAGADTWLATAAIDGVPAVLALDAGDRGVEVVGEQALADGSCWVELRIANASVAADRVLLIGDAAVDAVDSALTDGCVVTSAYLAGVAQGALNLTRDYLHQRVQFGQPIAAFQAVRHRIVDLELQRRLAFAAWRRACTEAGPRRAAAASAAKARCADVALLAARSGIQFHGAIGYTMEADIGLYLAAALRHAAAFGSASAHRRRFVESTVFSESPA